MVHRLDKFRHQIESIIFECLIHKNEYELAVMNDFIAVVFSSELDEIVILDVIDDLKSWGFSVSRDGYSLDIRQSV